MKLGMLRRGVAGNILRYLVAVAVCLAAGEGLLRVVFRDGETFSNRFGPIVARYERNFVFNRFDGPSRGPEAWGPKPPGVRRVLIQGDSITWGQGVREERAIYTSRLLDALQRDDPRVEMAVLAKPGREIDGHLDQLRRWGADIAPDLIIYQWYWNDMELDRSGRPSNRWQKAHRFLFHWEPMRHSYLWFYLDFVSEQLLPRPEVSYPEYISTSFAKDTKGWKSFDEAFHDWAVEAKRLTPDVLVMLYPYLRSDALERHAPALHGRLAELCEREGVQVLDLRTTLGPVAREPERFQASPYDAHPNAAAHDLIAGALHARLRAGAAASVPPTHGPVPAAAVRH